MYGRFGNGRYLTTQFIFLMLAGKNHTYLNYWPQVLLPISTIFLNNQTKQNKTEGKKKGKFEEEKDSYPVGH